ncbi:ABC transporter ATP-binding protein [Elioraea rosea]|uniref:ABC transporter ATP-binding protein n=1 Tax=Elioraea rosea TaxID=2492390 RepID=UPI001184944A|nr:ABC transporter ATP-binding protein [Elioraea rosea]
MTPLLEARGVTRTLPGAVPVTLVRDITLAIGEGEFVAVTGPSGSGKSSLLYLLGLLDRPTEGRVLIEGQDTAGLSAGALARLRRERLGFVFQFHFLLPEFTALENLLLPMRRAGLEAEAALRARAEWLLERFGLADAMRKYPEQLSGGMRQRVAVARALANDPALVLADEPTGNLDSVNAAGMFDLFESLVSEHGRSIVVVTHDPHLAVRAGRQVRLVDGRIVEDTGAVPA